MTLAFDEAKFKDVMEMAYVFGLNGKMEIEFKEYIEKIIKEQGI